MTTFTIYQWRMCSPEIVCVCLCTCVCMCFGNYVQFSLLFHAHSHRLADLTWPTPDGQNASTRFDSTWLDLSCPSPDALHNLHCFRFPYNYYLYNMYKFKKNKIKRNVHKKIGDRDATKWRFAVLPCCRFYGHLTNK